MSTSEQAKMVWSAKEASSAYELTWSLGIVGEAGNQEAQVLELSYEIQAFEELYIADRLWDYNDARQRVPDPFAVYRFVHEGSLRLVFAQAPYPSNMTPRVVYSPLCSRIHANEKYRKKILIKLPVDEYSSLARNIDAPTVVEAISKVFFVLSYCLRSSMAADPVPPAFETAENAGYIVHNLKQIVSSIEVDNLLVKRRSGYMARFALPGEPSPGPMPY